MKRGRKVLLIAVACGVAALVVLLVSPRERELVYRGKKLSEWVVCEKSYSAEGDAMVLKRPKANGEAIRGIGTNALPFLVEWIQYERPVWKEEVISAFNRLGIEVRDKQAERAKEAVWGFEVLREEASGVIPDLVRLLRSTNAAVGHKACSALGGIGKDAVPILLNLLTNRGGADEFLPGKLAGAWGRLGTNASLAVPTLIEHLKDPDEKTAGLSAALLAIGALEPQVVVPALAFCLQSTNEHVRFSGAWALGRFGKRGRPAVPCLVQALVDPGRQVRAAATNALLQIAPEALEKAAR